MRPTNAWGRVQFTNEEDRIGKPKDVFSRNPTGYPMWTEAMKAAIGPLRRAGRKWYSLYDKVRISVVWRGNSTFSPMETELWRAVCAKSTCTVRREGRVTTVPTPIAKRRGGQFGRGLPTRHWSLIFAHRDRGPASKDQPLEQGIACQPIRSVHPTGCNLTGC